ncbi:MAG: hypothetical protein M4579_006426 [Chaenotheca gracillima]|nr:MAG: hypothetical protein M4579_006426 [Chaenotheca gracillima]
MRFPWSSQPARDRDGESKSTSPAYSRMTPTVEIPVNSTLKRKRHLSDAATSSHRVDPRSRERHTRNAQVNGTKVRDEDGSLVEQQLRMEERGSQSPNQQRKSRAKKQQQQQQQQVNGTTTHDKLAGGLAQTPDSVDSATLTPLQQSIEAQFSLEILLKHRELRLIEQELAKCQIGLEQLRRCRLIPYSTPSTTLTDSPTQNNTHNTGYAPESSSRAAPWAGPWDVTNGPYTRHYAKWLIPDQKFDGPLSEERSSYGGLLPGSASAEGRATRGSFTDGGPTAGKGRMRGASTGSKLQALSNGYPQPKDKGGPLIIKRSDGQFVKLVCLDCERTDFSSAQGFINHCRIAHHRGFESHDAAANACGQVVEMDETGHLVGEGEGGSNGAAALVHPLIKSIPVVPKPAWQKPVQPNIEPNAKVTRSPASNSKPKPKRRRASSGVQKPTPSNFVPALRTPHLSALMQQKGSNENLGTMVGEASKKVDFTVYSSSEEDGEEESENKQPTNEPTTSQQTGVRSVPVQNGADRESSAHLSGVRLPATARMSPALLGRPNSSKGVHKMDRRPGMVNGDSPTLHLGGTKPRPSTRRAPADVITIDEEFPPALSPTNLESTNAPSLVSDDGEYEAHSESESPSSAEADENHDVIEFEVEDTDEVGGSETTVTDPELTTQPTPIKNATPQRTALRTRRSANNKMRRSGLRSNHHDERHVTFVSPEKPADDSASKRGGSRRRGARRG